MTTTEQTPPIGPAGIQIIYQTMGARDAPPVLLIMGVAAQLIHWPEAFCQRSWPATTPPHPTRYRTWRSDAVALLDYLDISEAHLVGASMGGQIAKTIAIEHPDRVRSLTSLMSTTGDPRVGQPALEVLRVVRRTAGRQSRAGHPADGARRATRRPPDYPDDEQEIAARAGRAYDRCYDPVGTARQAAATVVSGERTEALRRLTVPTLVIHGLADRMCNVSGGRATASAIPGAELVLIEGMGHNIAPGVRARLAALIADFVWKTERVKP